MSNQTPLSSFIRKVQSQLTFLALDKVSNQTPLSSFIRKVGRVIDRAGLEIRYTLFGYRGFESLTFRKKVEKKKRQKFGSLTENVYLCTRKTEK